MYAWPLQMMDLLIIVIVKKIYYLVLILFKKLMLVSHWKKRVSYNFLIIINEVIIKYFLRFITGKEK